MCGILGIYNLNSKPVSNKETQILSEALKHRGPDGHGAWLNPKKNLALGHRRLSILDLTKKGAQPMSDFDGRYWITFNGEIYNFIEIKNELEGKGHKFNTDTDTEVILASYKEWGGNMLHKFNGEWAFAIYDNIKKELFLSRDRFGIKPLYYFCDKKQFIFASEIDAIHKLLGNKHPLNLNVLKIIAVGKTSYHYTKETYLKNVFSLPAGNNLIVKENKLTENNWYKLNRVQVPSNFKEQAKKLRDLVINSCQIRLRSDVPIGTCLSGGVDSGSITSIIGNLKPDSERFSKYSHKSFCATFPNTSIDEEKEAKELASKLNTNLNIYTVDPPSEKELEDVMIKYGGPMHALAFYPINKLYEFIKDEGITVTMDGQGPDEMLGGYHPARSAMTAAIQLFKPLWLIDVYNTYASQGETLHNSSIESTRKNILPAFRDAIKKITKTVLIKFGIYNASTEKFSINFTNALDEELYLEFFKSPLPGILNQYDRCSMINGVECRMPFMDHRVVEFVFSLPPESKVGRGFTKRILREAMEGVLPDETRLRKSKIGFNAPIIEWFKGPLKNFMLKYINDPLFEKTKIFDGKKIKKEFEEFIKCPNPNWDNTWIFWPPVHIVWWMKYNKIIE